MAKNLSLSDLHPGQSAVIDSVGGEGALRQHFLDMGVIPGAQVTLVKFAPMGDPMELTIHGYSLTLRVDDAKKIAVSRIDAAPEQAGRPAVRTTRPHPGLGEGGKYHVKADEHPLPEGTVLTFGLAG
ncbi:MAG: ferrous iron transport protein A, partial [Clostridia bacterium]|nr:ferrous iron transport protein A [Clostridia bacterium]